MGLPLCKRGIKGDFQIITGYRIDDSFDCKEKLGILHQTVMTPIIQRPRRLRQNKVLRDLVRETHLRPQQLIAPLFVKEGIAEKNPIVSMPGQFRFPLSKISSRAKQLSKAGIRSVILFGIPQKKDSRASQAYHKNGIVQQAVKAIKDACPDLLVITDVCLCEYMDHGHCGVLQRRHPGPARARAKPGPTKLSQSVDPRYQPPPKAGMTYVTIDNDSSVELIAKTALSHAEAGADIVAPSDMMDGRVKAIRTVLDKNGFEKIPIMSYAVKYASSFYGPFREAAESTPGFGDRKSYQMDFGNAKEALKEARIDEEEGADFLIVKPALSSLDVISRVAENTSLPVIAYQVSGEYSMIVAAAQKGWIDRKGAVIESLTAIKRAGARMIISYFSEEIADSL